MAPTSLSIRRPDDWHVHLRDGPLLTTLLRDTTTDFARAIVMPNLTPPITTTVLAEAYRQRIFRALPDEVKFKPLMTCFLTDSTSKDDLLAGVRDGVFTAAKLYPAQVTTNAEAGVTNVHKLDEVFSGMSESGLPLLVHGEVVDSEVDVFDREAVFIERVLDPLRSRHPTLKVVFEHITTATAVDYVKQNDATLLAATITPHHLMINRNALFDGGLRPHMYCLPVAKREGHRQALRMAACSGDARFFLGTDSAPHINANKESNCGCAGIYNAPVALASYAQVFDEECALGSLEAFASLNGPAFYGLLPNEERICLERVAPDGPTLRARPTSEGKICVFAPPDGLKWRAVTTT